MRTKMLMLLLWALVESTSSANNDTSAPENGTQLMGKTETLAHYRRPQYFRGNFDPLRPKIGNVDESPEFDLKMKYLVHSVAFGVRVFKRLLDPIFRELEASSLSLQERFPVRIMPEDHSVGFYCETGFTDCVTFLAKEFAKYNLTVREDKATVMLAQKLGMCKKDNNYSFCGIQRTSEELAHRFEMLKKNVTESHPAMVVRQYKRLLTSMQFMCWYTVHEVYYLKYMLQCDTTSFMSTDEDERADNNKPFACAVYSFCPNPCNYKMRSANPCKGDQQTGLCSLDFILNRDFYQLLERNMKVTCHCEDGYTFDPTDGEDGACLEDYIFGKADHFCNTTSEDVYYYPDGAICSCKFGYVWDTKERKCIANVALTDPQIKDDPPSWHKIMLGKIGDLLAVTFKDLIIYYEALAGRLLSDEFVRHYKE